MSDLIKLIMDNLTKIDEHVLLELDLRVFVDLNATSVNDTHITDEISSVFADNHELTFPQFFVVGDLVVVRFTFSDLEDTLVAFKRELEVFELFGIHRFEGHVELVLGGFISDAIELFAFEARVNSELIGVQLTHGHAAEIGVVLEALKARAFGRSDGAVVKEDFGSIELSTVCLDLVSECIISHRGSSISNLLYVDSNLLGVLLNADKEVLVNTGLVVGG